MSLLKIGFRRWGTVFTMMRHRLMGTRPEAELLLLFICLAARSIHPQGAEA